MSKKNKQNQINQINQINQVNKINKTPMKKPRVKRKVLFKINCLPDRSHTLCMWRREGTYCFLLGSSPNTHSRSPIGVSHYHSFDKRRPNQTNGLDALHTGHVSLRVTRELHNPPDMGFGFSIHKRQSAEFYEL